MTFIYWMDGRQTTRVTIYLLVPDADGDHLGFPTWKPAYFLLTSRISKSIWDLSSCPGRHTLKVHIIDTRDTDNQPHTSELLHTFIPANLLVLLPYTLKVSPKPRGPSCRIAHPLPSTLLQGSLRTCTLATPNRDAWLLSAPIPYRCWRGEGGSK